MTQRFVTVVGGGPGGLMAAEVLATAGCLVTVLEKMPSVGRKFLLAGRGGLNLTHSEAPAELAERYGAAESWFAPMLEDFGPSSLSDWSRGLGEPTFVGTSGRVFPGSFRANALLRAWLARLDRLGVRRLVGRSFCGWSDVSAPTVISVRSPDGSDEQLRSDAVLLALGGASWPKVGGDGSWVPLLEAAGVEVHPLVASNVGVHVDWSPTFVRRHAGMPIKNVVASCGGRSVRGELMVTDTGLEGGAIYALSAEVRDAIAEGGSAELRIDLCPDLPASTIAERLARSRPKDSIATMLRRIGALTPAAVAILRESTGNQLPRAPEALAGLISEVPVIVASVESIDRAISSAGGIARTELDDHLMLRRLPGVFVAGEMIDWDAPTGGYLLQGTFSTAVESAQGVLSWLGERPLSA